MLTLILLFGAFIGWLMWSNQEQKQTFLLYSWVAMLVIGLLDIGRLLTL